MRKIVAKLTPIALVAYLLVGVQLPLAPAAVGDVDTYLNLESATNSSYKYLQGSDDPGFHVTNAITLEAWVYPTTTCSTTNCIIMSKENEYILAIKSGVYIYALMGATAWNWITTTVPAASNTWQHIALTRAASTNSITLYLNGVATATGTAGTLGTSTFNDSTYNFSIGVRCGLATGTNCTSAEQFIGDIDEVRVWSSQRTAAEILADMDSYANVGDANLKLYYDMNDVSGSSVANDVSGATSGTTLATKNSPLFTNLESTTISGIEKIITFNRSYITASGGFRTPSGVSAIKAVIVGGGGGGGDSTANATGGGGGAGGYFDSNNISVSGVLPITVGIGGAGSAQTTQGGNGGTSAIGTLKVGGGGGGNGVTYVGGTRARSGIGGSDFVSSGNGGGARPYGTATYSNEHLGGLAGQYAASGVVFLGNTYTGYQGTDGSNYSDASSGGMGGYMISASLRTSTISGASVVYAKISGYRAWEDALSTAGTKTPGSGGSPNYSYGTDPYSSGGAGAPGIVIIRFTITSTVSAPTYSGEIVKGTLESITVTTNVAGRVRFFFEGKKIAGCLSVATTGSSPDFTATCTWKPAIGGTRKVHAVFTPELAGLTAVTTEKVALFVANRSSRR
jgi:hypothetical protein